MQIKCIFSCFWSTPKVSQNFTPAVSARNLGVTFYNNANLRKHISQLVVAAFITFFTFVVFAGICLLLSQKLLQILLLAIDFTFCNIPLSLYCSQGYIETLTCATLFGNGLLVYLIQYHFLYHCIGSLSDIGDIGDIIIT